MSYCIYRINSTGEYEFDVDAKFPAGRRDGYTVLECGLKTRQEAEARIGEWRAGEKAKTGGAKKKK